MAGRISQLDPERSSGIHFVGPVSSHVEMMPWPRLEGNCRRGCFYCSQHETYRTIQKLLSAVPKSCNGILSQSLEISAKHNANRERHFVAIAAVLRLLPLRIGQMCDERSKISCTRVEVHRHTPNVWAMCFCSTPLAFQSSEKLYVWALVYATRDTVFPAPSV